MWSVAFCSRIARGQSPGTPAKAGAVAVRAQQAIDIVARRRGRLVDSTCRPADPIHPFGQCQREFLEQERRLHLLCDGEQGLIPGMGGVVVRWSIGLAEPDRPIKPKIGQCWRSDPMISAVVSG